MKVTNSQKSLLLREVHDPDSKEPWIMLCDQHDDRIVKNLSNKGLGYFVNNRWQYSWRRRSGYTNNFTLNKTGQQLRKELCCD